MAVTEGSVARRTYDNSRRRESAERTRERIVTAGADLVRNSIRDWRGVTIAAVAERAGVNRRTIYRHFASERELRDAVLEHQASEAGVDMTSLRLDGVAEAATRILRYVSQRPMKARPELDPTLADASRRQHDALVTAVEEHAQTWSPCDCTVAAATLDVLWSVASYERLVNEWQLDREEAIRAITWVIGLVETAIHDDRRPAHTKGKR